MSIALRNRLFGNRRPRSRTRPRRTFQSRLGRGIRIEPLEERALLAVAVAYVDDTWAFVEDVDLSNTLTVGDIVNNGNSGNGTIAEAYGVGAFGIVSSGQYTGSLDDYDEISEAIAATADFGETRVLKFDASNAVTADKPILLTGSFTIPSGNLTLNDSDGALSSGTGVEVGTITLSAGNLALTAGTFNVKTYKGVPGNLIRSSKIEVAGDVSIDTTGAGVALTVFHGNHEIGTPTDYTIVDNQGANPVTGTFVGLSEGATFTVNDRDFTISYTGGDGNDIVLTVDATYAFVTYVNDDWNGDGTTPDVGDVVANDKDVVVENRGGAFLEPAVTTTFKQQTSPDANGFTTSGWDTITGAIDAVAEGGAVVVLGNGAGQFIEDVTIDKQVVFAGEFQLTGDFTVNDGTNATLLAGHDGIVAGGGATWSIVGDLTLDDSTLLMMTVSGADTQPLTAESDQIDIDGIVDLGGARLELDFVTWGKSDPANIILIDNDLADAVLGTFADLPEGAWLVANDQTFWITYSGGDGNDVELVVPDLNLNASVVGRQIFYNDSFFDGNDSAINASDSAAIDTSKSAYLPGDGLATFANTTGYTKGINGIMVDIDSVGISGGIDASDFIFRVGSNNTPGAWAAAPAPSAVAVAPGAGISGSDRITITWANDTIEKTWLEVQVLSNARTGLPDDFGGGIGDVFFFGNKVANSDANLVTDGLDVGAVFANLGAKPVTNVADYNKTGVVDGADVGAVFAALGFLNPIDIDSAYPVATNPATFKHVLGPSEWTPGTDVTLVVSVPVGDDDLPNADIDRVDFYRDVNGNGVIDPGDSLFDPLTSVTESILDGAEVMGWALTFDPADLGSDAFSVIPVPVDVVTTTPLVETSYTVDNPVFRGMRPDNFASPVASFVPQTEDAIASTSTEKAIVGVPPETIVVGAEYIPEDLTEEIPHTTGFAYQVFDYTDTPSGGGTATGLLDVSAYVQIGNDYAILNSSATANIDGPVTPGQGQVEVKGNAGTGVLPFAVFEVISDTLPLGAPVAVVVRAFKSGEATATAFQALANGTTSNLDVDEDTTQDFRLNLFFAADPSAFNDHGSVRNARVVYTRVGDTITVDDVATGTEIDEIYGGVMIGNAESDFFFSLDVR